MVVPVLVLSCKRISAAQAVSKGFERRREMDAKKVNGSGNGAAKGSNEWRVKVGLAEMLKGGVIMDVTNAEQARIAEKAGACAVMALERVPSDIRKEGGVARMAAIKVIREIMKTVTIPVMAKVRIGHF